MKTFIFAVGLLIQLAGFSQTAYTWYNPAESSFPVIEGRGCSDSLANPYDRFPARAEQKVRKEVWDLSRNAAGLTISFMATTSEITVRYIVTDERAFPHMPATGVSGVDMYAIDTDGNWLWCGGKYSFGDTITYRFSGIEANDKYHEKGRQYKLFLPLYNTVKWLEIGVPSGSEFAFLPVRQDKPIVIYGTSIAQGGCASRSSTAWPSMLSRRMDRPVINLGFSGNGLLEKEVIDLMVEVDAKVFVLDCLPNLTPKIYTADSIRNKVNEAVRVIRARRGAVPILFVEHAGVDAIINVGWVKTIDSLNSVMRAAFDKLVKDGDKNLFLLTKKEINMDVDCLVDGSHPSDLGMLHYAEACEKTLRKILNEPIGSIETTRPRTQNRDANTYKWANRHHALLNLNKTKAPNIVFIGNSITHFWGGEPKDTIVNGGNTWKERLEPLGARNFGFGWDRIENVLWRVYHEELDGYSAKHIVIMIGTNNLDINSDAEIVEGLKMLIGGIRSRQPKSKIIMIGLLPRRDREVHVSKINMLIKRMADSLKVNYVDAGGAFLLPNKKIKENLFTDGLHPNEKGYDLLLGSFIGMLR